MPSNNRNAWRLPILVFAIFLLFIIVIITIVVHGYTSVDYDEVNLHIRNLLWILYLIFCL